MPSCWGLWQKLADDERPELEQPSIEAEGLDDQQAKVAEQRVPRVEKEVVLPWRNGGANPQDNALPPVPSLSHRCGRRDVPGPPGGLSGLGPRPTRQAGA